MLWAVSVQAAKTKIVLDSLHVKDDKLCISFRVDGLLNDRVVKSLVRGFTSEIVHQIRLWKTQRLVSSIAVEVNHTIRIYYDHWENRFAILTREEKRITPDIETLRERSCVIAELPLIDLAGLDPEAKYYVSIHTTFRPMSEESYQELKQWVSGRGASQQKREGKGRGRFFGVLLDLLGFGDKSFSFKSRDFEISAGTIRFVE